MTIRDAVARLRAESACEDAIEWFDAAIAGTPSKFRVEPEWLEWAMRNKCLPETFRPAWAAYLAIAEPARVVIEAEIRRLCAEESK